MNRKIVAAAGFALALATGLACGVSSTSNPPSDSSFTSAGATVPVSAVLAGTLLVGKDIAPGTYQGTATGFCYIARMGENEKIITNDLFEEGDKVTLTVKATDYSVKIDRSCGLAK
jgi:hypothetical protein